MDQTTVIKLNQLNNEFYSKASIYFDESRQIPWKGWYRLNTIIKNKEIKIENCLDVGSGNGRFGVFLHEHFPNVKYTGLDFNKELLDFSKVKLDENNVDFELINFDVLGNWEKELDEKFDLVVAFGVLHHIPGLDNRKEFVKKMINVTNDTGLTVITAWQFPKLTRFKKRMPPQDKILDKFEIDADELEENDYILDWQRGTTAYRYCHFTDEEEFRSLVPDTHKIVDMFEDDGKRGDVNKYYVIGRK